MSPQVGWQAQLNGNFHNVGGTVSILDDDTIQVDDFTYDGSGISVFFYLGVDDSSFASGLAVGPQLVGTNFDGTQDPLVIDLPSGETLEGYHAISAWCLVAHVDFGSGTFATVSQPNADFDEDGDVDGQDFLIWQRGVESGSSLSQGDANGDSVVDAADLVVWQDQYGTATPNLSSVPEPASILLGSIGLLIFAWRRS